MRETDLVRQHAELGEDARTFAILVSLVAVAFVVREWGGALRIPGAAAARRLLSPRGIGISISVALIATSALRTIWVVRAGHIGAKATWSNRPAKAGGAHEGDGDG